MTTCDKLYDTCSPAAGRPICNKFFNLSHGNGLRHENEKRGTTLPNVIYNNNANATARQEEVEIAAPTTPIFGKPNLPKIKA